MKGRENHVNEDMQGSCQQDMLWEPPAVGLGFVKVLHIYCITESLGGAYKNTDTQVPL